MRRIGYDLVTLGNHEFDYGPEVLAAYLQAAGYPEAAARTPVVATNTIPPAGHPYPLWDWPGRIWWNLPTACGLDSSPCWARTP